jgi:hypothetical protein
MTGGPSVNDNQASRANIAAFVILARIFDEKIRGRSLHVSPSCDPEKRAPASIDQGQPPMPGWYWTA